MDDSLDRAGQTAIDQLARSTGTGGQLLDRASRSIVTDDEDDDYHDRRVHPVLPPDLIEAQLSGLA